MIQWLIKLQAVIHGAIFNRGDSRGGRRRAITDQKRVVLGRQLANKDRIRQAQKDKALREASTKRAQRNMRKRAVKRLAWTIAGLVVVIIIGSNSLIRDVEIAESTPDFLSEDITRHAAEYFDTFSHRITWTFDSDAYANALMQEVTTIAEVKAIVPWFSTTLQVEASDRRESLGWIDQRRDSYFLVDSGGVAYKKVAELPSGIAVVTDVSGIRVDEGTTVVSASSLNSIRELFLEAQRQEAPISGFIFDKTTRDIEATLQGYQFRVKFTTNRTAVSQITDLTLVLNRLLQNKQLPSRYIDVRISGKAYYQ